MKKLILTTAISLITLNSYAEISFRLKFDEKNLKISSENQESDSSIGFDQGGGSQTNQSQINYFNSNKVSYFSGESVVLNWDVSEESQLNIYKDSILTDHVADVTGLSSLNINPIGDVSYYLDAVNDSSGLSLYEYVKSNNNSCGEWDINESDVNEGESFTKTRTCNNLYQSNEPSSIYIEENESENSVGTKVSNVQNLSFDVDFFDEGYYSGFDNDSNNRKYISANASSVPYFQINGEDIIMDSLFVDHTYLYVRFYNNNTNNYWNIEEYNQYIDKIFVDGIEGSAPYGRTSEMTIYWKKGDIHNYIINNKQSLNEITINIITK